MKLLIISSRFPYPLEKGDKLRLYYQIRSLARSFEIYLCSLTDISVQESDMQALKEFCKEIHVFPISGKKNALKAMFNDKPFQVNYFYDKRVHNQLKEHIARIKPDHVYYQLLRTTQYSFDNTISKSVDMMDCFSKGYGLRGHKEKGLRKKFYDVEARRLKLYENRLMDDFDLKFVISKQDKEALNSISKRELKVLSNGIDTQYFTAQKQEPKYDIVFVGNMGYEPNIYAVDYLLKEILPSVDDSIKVLIAGARPSPQLKAKANAQITVTGWMEDIRDAYNQSKVFLAPIRDGIGQQNKILEAMAMEVPCIVSKEVAQGLDIDTIEDYLFIADSKEDYIKYLNAILEDPKFASSKINKSKSYIVEHRSWDAVNEVLVKELQSD